MKCNDWQILVEEYFDGELDTDMALKVRSHLDRCSTCSSVLKSLSVERTVYAGYKSDNEVRPEMWAAVSQRINAPSHSLPVPAIQRFGSWLRNAVALPAVSAPVTVGLVVVAVVLTVIVMRYMSSPSGIDPVASAPVEARLTLPPVEPIVENNAGKHDESTSDRRTSRSLSANRQSIAKPKDPSRLVREAEQKYLAAIAMLSRNVDRKRSRLDPATVAELDQALSSIDRTIAATRNAVRRHPDDPLAAQYMLTAYAKKVDVLRGLADY